MLSDRPFEGEEQAERWMREQANDAEARATVLDGAAGLLNRALHAMAVSKQDPYMPQFSPAQAVAARVGHGLGPELAEGNFSQAIAVPSTERSRRRGHDHISPQERLAALLGGRESADICETFVLRARADFNAGRSREGILGLSVAVASMLIDLESAFTDPGHHSDLSLLRNQRDDLERLAGTARHGPLNRAEVERGEDFLAVCERVLRRRRLLRG